MPSAPWIAQESVLPSQAFVRWREHRSRFEKTRLWPLILSDPETYAPRLIGLPMWSFWWD